MWIPLTVVVGGDSHDLHLEATPESRVSDLEEALVRHLRALTPIRLASARGPLASSADLVSAGIRPGVVVHVVGDQVHTGPARAGSRRQLRVVGGPDAGLVVGLPEQGQVSIGRDAARDVQLSGTAVSREHATLICTPDAVVLTDHGSTNGSAIDGHRVTAAVRLNPTMLIQIGDDRLALFERSDNPAALARLTPLPDGTLRLERPQRFTDQVRVSSLSAPKPPDQSPRAQATISVAAGTGLLGGLVAYLMFHSPAFLVLSGASAGVGILTNVIAVLKQRRSRAKAQRAYESALGAHRAEVGSAVADERTHRLREAPDPAEVSAIAEAPLAQLWERRPSYEDFLRVRIGLADLPSELAVHHPDGTRSTSTLNDVPLMIDLATAGTIGLTGSRAHSRGLARWIVAQATVQSGPTDIRLAVLTRPGDRDAAVAWDWVRWLPHTRGDSDVLATVGSDESSLTARIDGLADLVAQRQQVTTRPGSAEGRHHHPQWLVVVDDLAEHDHAKLADIMSKGPDVGVSVVAIGQLPYRCPVVVSFVDDALITVRRTGETDLSDVLADQIGVTVATRIARSLAPLHDPQAAATTVGLPSRVSLLDQITLAALDPAALLQSWERVPRQTRVLVGQTTAGPLHVDLLANGPHALVAGATGSGKSAMLQTFVASLAAVNRPDELGFILVDFKGGAAFAPFEGLPHVLGTITNLDEHSVMRALDSLNGDLDRRQRHLAAAGVDSLSRYHELADRGALPPHCPTRLPRVFVVIDEFAMLKEGVPAEILDGLVHIATVGRSLGVHLILGTQAPRGVVPEKMRPNVNLKVAFRLDADHSADVIGVGDAQFLAGSGRGYLKRGDDGDLLLFQSSFVGGATRRRPGASVAVLEAPFAQLGHAPTEVGTASVSDIDVLVGAIREAAALGRIEPSPPPWLPDLPAVLPLERVPLSTSDGELRLWYGQDDQPERRDQPGAAWNLSRATHLLAAGRPRSGRSTLLRTLAASMTRYRPDEIHLYVMDCGGALADLASLPHCGAVVTHNELERGARLLNRLDELVTAHETSADPGAAAGHRTVLFIDDWESWLQTFGELDNGALLGQLTRLVRRGPAAGLHIAVTGGSALLTSSQSRALTESAQDRLVLPFDPEEYRWLGVPTTAIPGNAREGRAVRLGQPPRTLQVAVVGNDDHAAAQVAALRDIAARVVPAVHGSPWRVDALPRTIRLAEAGRLRRDSTAASFIPLGVGGDELSLLGVDVDVDGPAVYVTGEPRSGRSTALLAIGVDLVARGIPVVAITPNRVSALRALSDVAVLLDNRHPNPRLIQLALAAVEPPYAVLVDDADQLPREAGHELRELLVHAEQPWAALVLASGLEELTSPAPGTLLAEIGRGGTGVLLAPRTPRPQLFGAFVRIPPAYVGAQPPGRAVIVRRSGMIPAQVPFADADDVAGLPRRGFDVAALLDRVNTMAGETPTTVDKLRETVRQVRGSMVV